MQKLFQRLYILTFKIVEKIMPKIAGKWAVNIFFTPLRFNRPHREQAFMKKANIYRVEFKPDVKNLYDLEWARGRVCSRRW